MQEKYGQFEPLGICQKLFSFVVNSVIGRGLKRVTLGSEARQYSTIVPPDDSTGAGSPSSGQEIQVHFKQTEEQLEHWTPVNLPGSPVEETRKFGPSIDNNQLKLNKHGIHVKGLRAVANYGSHINPAEASGKADPTRPGEGSRAVASRSQGPADKSVGMRDVSEEERARKKGKKVALYSEKSALPAGPDQEQAAKYKFPMHLISVAPNINEKSDAFIRRKRQAMGLNGLIPKKP